MNVLNPLAFLFLLTVPLLVLLYFLKLKRPQIRVPSTLLWQKVIEDMRVNSPFQRLKRSLLLLLQILMLLAAIFALTRPLLRVREKKSESLIVILDTSASMAALEPGGKTRLELAQSQITELVDHLPREDEMMLIAFHSNAKVACGFTSNKRTLKKALSGVIPTECSTDIEPALLLAKSICNSRTHPRVLLFSDGAVEDSKDIDMPTEVEYHPVGSEQPNLAITGLDIRRSLNDRNKIEMFVAVENFSEKSFDGNMTVLLNDSILDSKYFSVGPKETLSQIFEALLPAGGNIKVKFDAPDALPCDNSAWKVVHPPIRRHILLVGNSTFFLKRVFKSSPGVECTVVQNPGDVASYSKDVHTVIWSGVKTPGIAPCHNIYLGCFPEVAGLHPGAPINAPDILDWDNAHPINRFLDFDNLIVASTRTMKLPEGGAAILRSSGSPLIGMLEMDHGSACVVAFDPMKSNWPLLVSFPLFLNNCLDYFEEVQGRRIETNISVGRSITVRDAKAPPMIVLPNGKTHSMRENPGGEYSFADANNSGIYQVQMGDDRNYSVAANLFNREESFLRVVEEPSIGGKTIKATQQQKQVNKEFWKYLMMAVAALLLLEWIVYHRRLFV